MCFCQHPGRDGAETYLHEDKTIIGLSVISYPIKPISFKGKYYKRVRQSMAEAGAPAPVFEIIAQNFKVTLFPSGGVNGGVSGGVNDLLNYIKANPGKKSREIKTALNLPQRTLERWLKELREQNKIRFQGAPKTGGYFPVDDT